jgi:hypothetical protein
MYRLLSVFHQSRNYISIAAVGGRLLDGIAVEDFLFLLRREEITLFDDPFHHPALGCELLVLLSDFFFETAHPLFEGGERFRRDSLGRLEIVITKVHAPLSDFPDARLAATLGVKRPLIVLCDKSSVQ